MVATLRTRYLGNAIIVYPNCALRSECALPRPSDYTSAERLTNEINRSPEYTRHRFLFSLIVGGCTSMLEALLFHGLSMGDFPVYYMGMATTRGRMDVVQLLLKRGASSSLETSTHLLRHMEPNLGTFLRDPNKSETFCHLLTQILDSFGPLQEIGAEHALFDSLVPVFREALLLSIEEQTSSTLNSDIIQLLLRHGAFLSPKPSTRLLEHLRPHYRRFLRDPSKSETFCNCLAQVLDSCGPLQELDDEHPLFESLVLLFQQVLLLSSEEQTSIASNSDDGICNRIIGLLLEAGLFRDSKLPARYWSFHDLLCNRDMNNSPLMLAIYVRNVYAVKLLLHNGYDVDETRHCHGRDDIPICVENRGTPLTYAIWLGSIEAVTVLLAAGADVTKMGVQGQTAAKMSEKCLLLPIPRDYKDFAEDIDSEDVDSEDIDFKDSKDEHYVRRLIFNMVCADLEAKHGMQYNQFIDTIYRQNPVGSCWRFADNQHTTTSFRYWSSSIDTCAYCPNETLGLYWQFTWGGFSRKTLLCPCSYCLQLDFKSSHSPLPDSWEGILAPCKCSFIEKSDSSFELTYVGSDGFRYGKSCPLGNGDDCCLRVLYINHVTGEATLHCPCAICSPDWKGVPSLTLGSLFGQDEFRLLEEIDDPLIPAQDLTRVGEPCWLLGDLFNDDKTEDLGYEDDSIIPAQDVGLHIFDDMPGFALAKNHRLSATHEVPLVADTPKSQPTTAEKSDLGSPNSRATAVLLQKSSNTAFSTQTFFSLFASYIVTRSTPFADIPRPVSMHEVMEVSLGLSISVLLVIIYECISIYTYMKDLPRPPPFLSKLVLLVLVVLGLRALKGNFGLV